MQLLRFLVRERRKIFVGTILAGIVGAVFSFIIPAKYKATSCIMPSMDMVGMSMGGGMQSASSAMSMLQFIGGVAITPQDIYADLVKNRVVIKHLIDKFRLDTVYKAKNMDVLIENVKKHIETEATSSGLVYLRYKDRSPKRAAMLCNALVDELDRLNRDIIITKGKRLRIFLGKRLKEVEDSMTLYQDSLAYLQKRYGILDLTTSLTSIIQNWQDVETNYFETKLQYEFAVKEQGPGSKVAQNLKHRLNILTREKFNLWNIAFDTIASLPALKKLPDVGAKYVRIQLMLEKYTDIYKFLTTEYEKAKIMEKQDTPTLQVIFKATVPKMRYWPQRKLIVLLFMAIFFFTYITLLVIYYSLSKSPEGKEAMDLLKRLIFKPFGRD